MAMKQPPVCDFGWRAPDFALPATDGKTYGLADLSGPKGLLIMFICNHCPYVIAILDRITRDALALQDMGMGVAAICANDAVAYPADSFENMARLAAKAEFSFPYLHDATQEVARAYDAQCTPDFFGFDAALGLQYRGRLDGSGMRPGPADMPSDLVAGMRLVADTGAGPKEQIPSMGCSIKWCAA